MVYTITEAIGEGDSITWQATGANTYVDGTGRPMVADGPNAVVNGLLNPVITVQPVSQVVTEPDVAVFTITATGTGTLSNQWKREGGNVGTDSATYTTAATDGAGDQRPYISENDAAYDRTVTRCGTSW